MMSRVHVDADKLDRLADAVGAKSGVPLKLTIDGMVDAVLSIEDGITPTGTKHITSNGKYDVAKFEQAEVDVKAPPIKTQTKTVIPTEDQRTVLPDSGYDGLSEVTVQPIVYNDLVLTPGTASEVYYSPRTTNSVTFLRRGVVIHAGEAPALEYSKSEQFDTSKTLHAILWCSVRPYQRESYEIQTDVLWAASDGMTLYDDDSISVYVNSSKLFVTNVSDVDVTLDIQFDAYCDAIEGVTLKGVKLQDISVTPTKQYQYLRPEQPNIGFENVTVQAIPAQYVDTSDADAVAADIALGRTAYAGGHKLTGTLAPVEVEPLSVTENGTYTAPTGTAYSPVTVNVEGGGGGAGSMSDPIRFFDYDGELVASYTAVPAELPDVPTHTGLVDGAWNYTLADVQEQFAAMGTCDVGANFATESGATEIDVVFDDPNIRSPYLAIAVNGTVTVDWGDGSPTGTMTGSSYTTLVFLRHEYAETGAYTISISGPFAFYGTSGSRGSVLKEDTSTSSNRYLYANCIREIRLGTNASVKSYAFSASTKLTSISIPTSLSVNTSIDRMFSTCFSLKFAAIPRGSTGCPQYGFQSCYELAAVSLPITVEIIPQRAFYYCSHLSSVSIPKNVNSLGSECFRLCGSLTRIVTPPGISHIPQYMCHSCGNITSVRVMGVNQVQGVIQTYAFYGLNVMTEVDLPPETKNIGDAAFSNCYSIDTLHIRATNPPTIYSGTFNYSMYNTAKIYVPYSEDHSILEAYKTASVWKNYASRMVEEPQS